MFKKKEELAIVTFVNLIILICNANFTLNNTTLGPAHTAIITEKLLEGSLNNPQTNDIYVAIDDKDRVYIVYADDLQPDDIIEFKGNNKLITICEYVGITD